MRIIEKIVESVGGPSNTNVGWLNPLTGELKMFINGGWKSVSPLEVSVGKSSVVQDGCVASGENSSALGLNTEATGTGTHAEGVGTIAQNKAEHAQGQYNVSNKASDTFGNEGNTIHSIGIGTSSAARKNAVEVMQNGDMYLYGVGGYDGTNPASALAVQEVMSIVEITYSNLKNLRDNSKLQPGQKYRITDYQCTTSQENTQSAGHQFDIIVLALDESTLSEEAYAAHHEGDTYFANNNLSAWKLWYSIEEPPAKLYSESCGEWLDYSGEYTVQGVTYHGFGTIDENDIIMLLSSYEVPASRYPVWTTDDGVGWYNGEEVGETVDQIVTTPSNYSGKISRMIDEFNNDCPYDFKNIQFARYEITACEAVPSLVGKYGTGGFETYTVDESSVVYAYTFSSEVSGGAVTDSSLSGSANSVYGNIIKEYSELNNIVFFGNNCNSNIFGNNCASNTFGDRCSSNIFGNNCSSNIFSGNCNSNTFGDNCNSNIFGDSCYSNTFGKNCTSSTFGDNCSTNIFGNNCGSNIFGNNCSINIFGNRCGPNIFGNNCQCNTFGNGCSQIKFGDSSSVKSYYRYIVVENGNNRIYLYCTRTTSSAAYYQNVTIAQGVNNTTTWKTITDTNVGQAYQTVYKSADSQTILV